MHHNDTEDPRAGKAPSAQPEATNGATRPTRGDPLAPSGRIGAQLRALYDEIEREPIPADLLDLLSQLDEAEKRQGS